MEDIKLVVCDIAGTAIVDNGQVSFAFTDALRAFGVEVTSEQLHGVRGASKREAIQSLIPAAQHRERDAKVAYQYFCSLLRKRFSQEGIRPIPGTNEIFEWLRERKIRIALNTGFYRDITDMLLMNLGWAEGVVDAIVCGDDVPQGRPAPYMIFRTMELTGMTSVHFVANKIFCLEGSSLARFFSRRGSQPHFPPAASIH
ncbi:MAG: HAD hydrolase-like protein [bacterium]